MLPINLVKPGILEIKGNFSHSPSFYVPITSIRSFVVHHRPPTIELHLCALTPNGATALKCIDCKADQLIAVAEFIAECISTSKPVSLSEMTQLSTRVASLEKDAAEIMHIKLNKALEESMEAVQRMTEQVENNSQTEELIDDSIYSEEGSSETSEKVDTTYDDDDEPVDLNERLWELFDDRLCRSTLFVMVVTSVSMLGLLAGYAPDICNTLDRIRC